MFYGRHPQAALEIDSARKTVIHTIAQLFGDVGGMLTTAWKDFAISIMHDHPELLTMPDKNKRTPLHLCILFLGDTAIGARDKQDPKTRRYTAEVDQALHTIIALYPEALEMREEYDLTPLDLINHKRLTYSRGSAVCKKSPIIKAVKKMLQRDEDYWEMAGELERSKIALKAANQGADSAETCNEIQSRLTSLKQRLTKRLEQSDVQSNETEDKDACPDTSKEESRVCRDEAALIQSLSSDLERLASMIDASLGEE